ncbi:MAG: NAD(P)H-hydrate dehydratase [Flavobacteriales bacterium]|nr:NAD(P)H-hydrate dehydratase [Flavobacteriales bacterium]MBK6945550.1 NAD(P)H-hydrate dehydratase [Flavobacteriales bacterium]MBK7241666.1 NAD(P)H-hydrate dehydratase [Flavobacteriales bacterium]MBK9534894.1 NAD(P)H-hydrate dehydratase [Flavobacteriales bacterium]MBP9138537.1 NAD(P)H-hydrate dehydratase [Flavobacteriales bacterium]
MIPVLIPKDVKEADQRTLKAEGISSLQLMERAAKRCTERILELVRADAFGLNEVSFVVFVGMGNNGGDGLAIARLLQKAEMEVRVLRVLHTTKASADHLANLEVLKLTDIPVVEVELGSVLFEIAENEVVIDALLGIGASGPLNELIKDCVKVINNAGNPVIAIDVPTGLDATGSTLQDPEHIIRARWTLTIGVPKMALFLADRAPFVGHWQLVPIELDLDGINKEDTFAYVVEQHDVADSLRPKPLFGHKGTFGHALVIAGSTGKMGAAVLATNAALRSGAGLVTAHVPADGISILQTLAPEAMCSIEPSSSSVTRLPELSVFTSIGVGPGLGSEPDTKLMLKRLIQDANCPMVFDADALNILAEEPTWIAFLPPDSILTPHPKEFDRLVHTQPSSSLERLELAREFAVKNRCVLVLKGAWTAICSPQCHVRFNPTGNPGMAKGGSGDALTGLITGLLAQGYSSDRAAMLGVYLHGMAGDLAASTIGMDGMTAMDTVNAIPAAWRSLRGEV